jgi:hypothetical protein
LTEDATATQPMFRCIACNKIAGFVCVCDVCALRRPDERDHGCGNPREPKDAVPCLAAYKAHRNKWAGNIHAEWAPLEHNVRQMQLIEAIMYRKREQETVLNVGVMMVLDDPEVRAARMYIHDVLIAMLNLAEVKRAICRVHVVVDATGTEIWSGAPEDYWVEYRSTNNWAYESGGKFTRIDFTFSLPASSRHQPVEPVAP